MLLKSLLLAFTAFSVLATPVMQARGESTVSVSKRQDMMVDGTDGSQDSDGTDHDDSYVSEHHCHKRCYEYYEDDSDYYEHHNRRKWRWSCRGRN
ncbi:hypothetical protein HDU98_012087 [Podochytrium sp. JEL0797]|nr:hypothetical protein HDU98_012087 [Podochytrium sp. JEL0797]